MVLGPGDHESREGRLVASDSLSNGPALRHAAADVSEPVWLQHSIEGLLRGLPGRMTPHLQGRLREVGVDVKALVSAYSRETVARAVGVIADELFPSLEPAARERETGKLFIRGYGRTLVGASMLQLMRIIGPRMTLERMQRNFRTGTNFIETRFTSLGPRAAELWFNDHSGVPEFYAGILEEGATHTGAKRATVTVIGRDERSCTVRVDWEE